MTKLWSAGELANAVFEDPIFLVDPLIPQGGLVLLHGKRGLGKTQLALSLCESVCRGTKWLRKWKTQPGNVVYIQADMTPQLQHLRLSRLKDIYHMNSLWFTMPIGLRVTHMESSHPELCEEVRRVDPVLMVWDTLRKVHRLQELGSESSQAVFSSVKQSFPRATHLFVGHDRKDSRDPRADAPEEEEFRGSGDWIDSADASFHLTALRSGSPKRLVLRPLKCRSAPEHEKSQIILEMDPWTIALAAL